MPESTGPSASEIERLKALRNLNIIDTPGEQEFDNISKVAALICQAPMAVISLVDEERVFYKSIQGTTEIEVPREVSFSGHTIKSKDILEVRDATKDPRFKDHPGVSGDPHVRFYAGAPLTDDNGHMLGVLGVFDTRPRELTPEQREGLKTLANEIITHITLRQRSTELMRLSFVASKINNGVVISDANSKVAWVNAAFTNITGYTIEDLRGKRLGDLLSGPDTDYAAMERARAMTRENKSFTVDLLAYRKDNVPIWLSIHNTLVLDPQGKLESEVEILIDITEKKRVEKDIIESREQAVKLSEAKEMFLSVMSHEIRTPLNAVIGMTNLLIDNDPKPSQIEDLNVLKFSAENLLNIINDILDLTKIETGNMQLESIPFSIRTLIGDISNSLRVSAMEKGNKLEVNIDDQIPQRILGDKTRLYQILMNLLGNAVKFTSHGTIHISARLVAERADSVDVLFEVRDNGIGIPADKLEYIFESFTQAGSDVSRKYGGTGLGLAITRRLLQLHGSDIEVQSREHEGTAFSFSISYKKVDHDDQNAPAAEQAGSYAGCKILVVDDNDVNILIANRILNKWGPEVDSASNGKEAIEKIIAKAYDLIFMDINMPGLDGFDTTSIIREMEGEQFKTVPIIALTASTLEHEYGRFKASGMNGHLLKPFRPADMKAILDSYLRK
ncbi:ATP-binding protein [Pedobacter deserti]|uniref:ATP-binding protein n=1 Tax=Pedobacter deserti TaxID=2817382 RepID=UPI00210E145F|nr:ATP-binding protein [Pedobacter sp. SYSU D00382]